MDDRYPHEGLGELRAHRTAEELLEALRGVELPTLRGATTKLSRFTLKQMARRDRVVPGAKKSGSRFYKPRRRQAWQTRRKKERLSKRSWRLTPRGVWTDYRTRYGDAWGISWEEWKTEIGPLVSGRKGRLLKYPDKELYTIYSVYVLDQSGKTVYDGLEAYMKDNGYIY